MNGGIILTTIIALTNQKGGVGKTTTSSALAAGLSSFYNKKVLAIDFDPQGSLGFSLGLDIENSSTIRKKSQKKNWKRM
jgi:chromosome partitioning protein